MRKGRKGYGEELKIIERYSDLSEDYFRTLKEFINSDVKEDRKFAVQQLTPAFSKMIPQDQNHGGEVTINIAKEIADRYEITPSSSTNSTGQAPLQGS